MDLSACHTMPDLVEKVKLYLVEELDNQQILYFDIAHVCDQAFRIDGWDMDRLRLLPGPGREGTYVRFLRLLKDTRAQDGLSSFKLIVHAKQNPGT